ncbi:MAG: SMP-30/gluconolactonase/LRE family protein [Acidimicrobiia bacterium]
MPQFDPHPWQPLPAPKLTDEFAENDLLAEATLIDVDAEGPEDIAVGQDGTMYTGTADGVIHAVHPSGTAKPFADVGGRPLGIEKYGDDLVVSNADVGLQLVSKQGTVKTLVDTINGERMMLANNATVAADGTIYFTDSSRRWHLENYVNDLVEGQPTGRVFARSPDGSVSQLADGLQFANGVALDGTEESIFIAETGRYRVYRHWIKGDRTGEAELFLDNLPGFPDNLSFGDDTLWIGLASPRQGAVDVMQPRGWMRTMTYRMPERLKPKPVRHGIVLGYSSEGVLTHNLQDTTGTVAITTSARFHDGRLIVGMLKDPMLAVVELS